MQKYIYLATIFFVIASCASFPVPNANLNNNCKLIPQNKDKINKIVLEFETIEKKDRTMPEHSFQNLLLFENNPAFLKYTEDILKETDCFIDTKVTGDHSIKKEVGVLYFTINKYFSTDESYLKFPFLTIITLGIYPMWSKIITEIRVSEYKAGLGEVEVLKYSYERYQVLSIFIAPVGVYKSLVAPKGLNANEAAQFETNKYLINEALVGLKKKEYL